MRRTALIKSNNPHLAGGEKNTYKQQIERDIIDEHVEATNNSIKKRRG